MVKRQGGGRGPRYGKNVDANQLEIVQALEKIGCDVCEIGWPLDLLVGYRGQNWLLEVKDGNKKPSDRKLTDDEQTFFDTWRGHKAKVETIDEALAEVTKL